ncbi:DUF397 domain-containing protein [Streptomyces kaniharaensis]|uniref:DUF397 domain-containing protein n=1 Tax=Streptomyces kaniharaensis TaxID=212423 RepID=UPI001E2D1C88|nr:DUF397 domain-containing protein [Streptomyces kaniharaensis]
MRSPTWQKSSYSGANSECVEVRAVDGVIELRESDEGDVIVRTTPVKFATFLQGREGGRVRPPHRQRVANRSGGPLPPARGRRQRWVAGDRTLRTGRLVRRRGVLRPISS